MKWFETTNSCPDTKARAGCIRTNHGAVHTPIFMPVGTKGSVKGISQEELADQVGAEIILGNTYHLYLRPGTSILQNAGGLHQFIRWTKPILTDSGGYQIFSLAQMRKLSEEGAVFQSHIDGSKHLFTPENNVDIQRIIGADFIMAFDECTPYPCDYHYAKNSLQITHQWLKRGWEYFNNSQPKYPYPQLFIPIIQGSTYPELRILSTENVLRYENDIYAIGGLSVGEPEEILYDITEKVCDLIPGDKARYLMGVGTPINLLECISRGIDMFDCVLPTRNARHGLLYTRKGVIHIKNAKWKTDYNPIDAESPNESCRYYSKAYLHHLFRNGEMLGARLASLQNLSFYMALVKEARNEIIGGTFKEWKEGLVKQMNQKL